MLKHLELSGFKSFPKKATLEFNAPVTAIVGPNGSGKSNVAEAIRFVLGEQSIKSLRSKKGEDLIWNGSKAIPQTNRAAVSITFDNSKRVFKFDGEMSQDLNLGFDEIVISREVYRDGVNKYLINGSQVRLRDIIELLASVNIGASGHHIISQGEADRILNSSAKDRRVMIEESLGLKIYHWKIGESERKLGKTNENLDKAESLRREILPHIKFLKKQVEKIERAEEMRSRLAENYAEYLKKEETYLGREKRRTEGDKHSVEKEVSRIDNEIKAIKDALARQGEDSARTDELHRLDSELRRLRAGQEELSRKLGRADAKIEFIVREERALKTKRGEADVRTVPFSEVEGLAKTVESVFSEVQNAPNLLSDAIVRLRRLLADFLSKHRGGDDDITAKIFAIREELAQAESEKREIEGLLTALVSEENKCNLALARAKEEGDKNKDANRDRERLYYEFIAKRSEASGQLNVILSRLQIIAREEASFVEEIKEGSALIGQEILKYKRQTIDETAFWNEPRSEQEARRKEIEKIKIRLEDMGGGGGSEILKEYKDMEERDQFLTREIDDLKKSAESLSSLIKELKEKLDVQFDEGIEKINEQFEKFFNLMFGGGSAGITVFEEKKKTKAIDPETGEEIDMGEDEEIVRGIDIKVHLPQKKIKDLAMLSGGERALTSIALLFAISQVNPPPFMVLDETDAALDEANSRKYGEMLGNLSKLSQLVVITHNRETMSRAQVLYGITTGGDAASKLLSIKFDEAVDIAK